MLSVMHAHAYSHACTLVYTHKRITHIHAHTHANTHTHTRTHAPVMCQRPQCVGQGLQAEGGQVQDAFALKKELT